MTCWVPWLFVARERSPARIAASGTLKKRNSLFDRLKPSYDAKKNSLSRTIGPPSDPPNMCCSSGSLFGFPLFSLQLNPQGRNEYAVALSFSLLKNSNAEPLNWFVPDLVMTVMAAPPAIPCSASNVAVDTLTVSIVSAGATYITWFGSQMLTLVAPSVRVALFVFAWPLTLVVIERAGVSVSALPNDIGIVPGTRLTRAW